jgi:lipid-A-disaccharide synthase-like uncharacterized protein
MSTSEKIWVAIGLIGQAMFSMRFVLQWLASEKQKKSVIPITFWYFSIAGSLILLAYAIYRRDPVFILGQSFGMFVYLRNLYFILWHKNKPALSGESESPVLPPECPPCPPCPKCGAEISRPSD